MISSIGQSPAGQRIAEAGIRYQRMKTGDPTIGMSTAEKFRYRLAQARLAERRKRFERHVQVSAAQARLEELRLDRLIKMEEVSDAVCQKYDINEAELVGDCRLQHLTPARKEFSEIMVNNHGASIASVARFLNRDHTSVLYYLGRKKR